MLFFEIQKYYHNLCRFVYELEVAILIEPLVHFIFEQIVEIIFYYVQLDEKMIELVEIENYIELQHLMVIDDEVEPEVIDEMLLTIIDEAEVSDCADTDEDDEVDDFVMVDELVVDDELDDEIIDMRLDAPLLDVDDEVDDEV